MKNKIITLLATLFLVFFSNNLFGEDLYIESTSMDFDKKKQLTIFKDKVMFKTKENKTKAYRTRKKRCSKKIIRARKISFRGKKKWA